MSEKKQKEKRQDEREQSHDLQVRQLNEWVLCKIAPSEIHGVGVFALRDIPKGVPLYAEMMPKLFSLPYDKFDRLLPEVGDHLLERWPQIVNGSYFGYPDTRIQAFMNHSDDPNYDAKNDITLKEIKAGEEILEDYNQIENAEEVYPWLKK